MLRSLFNKSFLLSITLANFPEDVNVFLHPLKILYSSSSPEKVCVSPFTDYYTLLTISAINTRKDFYCCLFSQVQWSVRFYDHSGMIIRHYIFTELFHAALCFVSNAREEIFMVCHRIGGFCILSSSTD